MLDCTRLCWLVYVMVTIPHASLSSPWSQFYTYIRKTGWRGLGGRGLWGQTPRVSTLILHTAQLLFSRLSSRDNSTYFRGILWALTRRAWPREALLKATLATVVTVILIDNIIALTSIILYKAGLSRLTAYL